MKIGLVLSGGGGKGAYELGVWKALKELDLDKYIDVFSGASIGAFNAILFAQDDMQSAENLWDEVTMDKLVPISKFELIKRGVELVIGGRHPNFVKKYMMKKLEEGGVPKDGAREIINKYLNIEKVKRRGKICYAACTELPDFTPKYFKINDYEDDLAKEIIVASASLPMIYDCTDILNGKYIDGGVVDNTPIFPVYRENCDVIIVVLLSKDVRIDKSLYPNTKILELIPKNLNENTLNGTLNLDMKAKKMRINEGYNDTITLLEPILMIANLKREREERKNHPKLFRIYNFLKGKNKK